MPTRALGGSATPDIAAQLVAVGPALCCVKGSKSFCSPALHRRHSANGFCLWQPKVVSNVEPALRPIDLTWLKN